MCCIQGGKTALSAVFFVGVRKSVNVSKKKAFPKAYDGPRSPAAQDVWRSAFGVWRSAFGVWRSAFGVWPSAFRGRGAQSWGLARGSGTV
jgi:hypothetical protein